METRYKFIAAIRALGQRTVEAWLPEPLTLRVSDHDTGCQIDIEATVDDRRLTVWRSSEWYSSSYEFNERGKIGGLQPQFEFMRPALDEFFARCRKAWADKQAEAEERRAREEEARADADNAAIEKLRRQFTT